MATHFEWEFFSLKELTTKIGSGATPRGGGDAYKESGIPLIRSMNVHFQGFTDNGLAYIDDEQAERLKSATVKNEDVLLNITGASIGRVTTAPQLMDGARVNQHVSIVRPNGALNSGYLAYYLGSPAMQQEIMDTQSGATRQALTKAKIENFQIPTPPVKEQHRIADKIDTLQAKSRRAREALETAKPLLEKFRQSVLAAAFRGELTAEWRKQNPDVKPVEMLLERIRTERRARWEEAELEKMRAKGKEPKNDKWKAKYKEPVPVDTSELPDLPKGWCWASLDQLTSLITSGSRGWGKYYAEEGALFLRVGNLDRDSICLDLTNNAYVLPPEGGEGTRTLVQQGDLLLSITADVGMVAVADDIPEAYINQHVALLRPCAPLNSATMAYALSDPMGLQKIVQKIQYGMTKASLSLVQVRSLPIPVLPLEEQAALEKELKQMDSKVVGMKKTLAQQCEKLLSLEQAILTKAFRGELVPQDPNDEPASVLLERIKAELEASKPKKRTRKKAK